MVPDKPFANRCDRRDHVQAEKAWRSLAKCVTTEDGVTVKVRAATAVRVSN